MQIEKASQPFIEYHAIRGAYGKVSYFMTKTPLRDVAENLMLAPQGSLSFHERIQRVVNMKRVEEEILPYLENNELRFFNSLVCILLPDTDSEKGFWEFQEYTGRNGESLGGLGKLRIAKSVGRIVLDGQHRFEALRMYWRKYNHDLFRKDENLEIALVFVSVDSIGSVGNDVRDVRKRTILAVRNLFAVLNKTARSVDRTTLLLIDDTDILNVFTRKLVEDQLLDESLIKWTGGQNLNLQDPYFTALHVIRDAVAFFLRDFAATREDYGDVLLRNAATEKYYNTTPGSWVPIKDLIPFLIENSGPFRIWRTLLDKNAVYPKLQPERTELTKKQSKVIEQTRQKELVFTVAGQRAYFCAILDAFQSQAKKDMVALKLVMGRADHLHECGLFKRDVDKNNPFLDLLIDQKGRMIYADISVNCSRQVFSIALGGGASRKSVVEQYRALTDNSGDVLYDYWKAADKVLNQLPIQMK